MWEEVVWREGGNFSDEDLLPNIQDIEFFFIGQSIYSSFLIFLGNLDMERIIFFYRWISLFCAFFQLSDNVRFLNEIIKNELSLDSFRNIGEECSMDRI